MGVLTQKFLDRMCVPYKFFFSPSTCSSDWGWNSRGFNPIFWSPELPTVPLPECHVSCGHRAVRAAASAGSITAESMGSSAGCQPLSEM